MLKMQLPEMLPQRTALQHLLRRRPAPPTSAYASGASGIVRLQETNRTANFDEQSIENKRLDY
jgi:hypothetical protein